MLSVNELLSADFSEADKDTLWQSITAYYTPSEDDLKAQFIHCLSALKLSENKAAEEAKAWISQVRELDSSPFSVNKLMAQFGLETDEGLALLSLAEALLRIPDTSTAEALILDKLDGLQWQQLFDNSQRNPLSASTIWGIAISQELINAEQTANSVLDRLWLRLGKTSLHKALTVAMSHLGGQFVFAEEIHTALSQRADYSPKLTAFSFDMLGEAAICKEDVDLYFQAYMEAIQAAGEQNQSGDTSISIKLSALHPRLENSKLEDIQKRLLHNLYQLAVTARNLDIALTIDAEESERLELSLLIFEQLLQSEICQGWGKLGLAVQAYSKRALPVLRWLAILAEKHDTEIPIRLVKGAYWDSEIKQAQHAGLEDYPVYTRKVTTDLSYLICSQYLLSEQATKLQPQLATHNALTIAQILTLPTQKKFEFQRLHGMAEPLYQLIQKTHDVPCRIYAPIGDRTRLLPYLVRRLLENGSNSSFVFKLSNPCIGLDKLTQPIISQTEEQTGSVIPLPPKIYLPQRENAKGDNLGCLHTWQHWQSTLKTYAEKQWFCQPIVAGEVLEGDNLQPINPSYQLDRVIGYRSDASSALIKQALSVAEHHFSDWRDVPLNERCNILRAYAGILEEHKEELVCLCVFEAGKTLADALSELREAIDFCYYYANLAEQQLLPEHLPAITGEENTLHYRGKGIFTCISPWNFPLAIFTGQIAAALVTGNTVLAKPSSNTSLIAFRATELWYAAGLPEACLQLIPYTSDTQSDALLGDSRLEGVMFTGSTQTARQINLQLANRHGSSIATMIAETGGMNAMIIDSSSLAEQVVQDCLQSAFNSAGQRCSALRVLYVQEEIAIEIEQKLIGAMAELQIGNPENIATDISSVINKAAMLPLYEHIERCRVRGKIVFELPLEEQHNNGYFVPPTLIRLHSMDELEGEVFGPVLHIIRYARDNIDRVVQEINRTGFGLTLGIHSRNDQFIDQVVSKAETGNIYINRDQIGAIVGAQPFGGVNLSGTGPKAGGPNYLKRLVNEQTVTRNTTASGGNRELLSVNQD